jgi:sacsin
VYNNAVFTPEDWHGIQEIARSRKKDDPLKVGRFGIGFNSVYHITGAVLDVGKWGGESARL